MFIVSALYRREAGSRFDPDYYSGSHASLARRLLAPELESLRITLGQSDLAGGSPAFHAISEMRFASRAAFDAAMARAGTDLFADAKNYTDVAPVLQQSLLAADG